MIKGQNLNVLNDFEITKLYIPKKNQKIRFFNVFGKNEEISKY
jgi:hypothetical protein